MALIGNGAQSEFQAVAFHTLLGIKEISVFDVESSATDKLVCNLSAYPALTIRRATSTADAVLGADIVTGLTATISALGNIGPGFNQVGPMAHYADLHPVSRVALTLTMWIGRLEVLTVLVILRPEAWREGQWALQRRHARV